MTRLSCCCNWGSDVLWARQQDPYVLFFSPSFVFDPPDGSSSVIASLILRNQGDFAEIKWSGWPSGIGNPSITTDSQGNFYAGNVRGVAKFDRAFNTIWTYGTIGVFGARNAIWIDADFNVYFSHQPSSPGGYKIVKLDSGGNEIWTYDGVFDSGVESEVFSDLCVDTDGEVTFGVQHDAGTGGSIVTTYRIEHLDSSGASSWTVPTSVSPFGGLSPAAFAVDSDNNIYNVRRESSEQIFKYNQAGSPQWSRSFGGVGLNTPADRLCMCLDGNGDIFVGGRSVGTTTYQIKKIDGSSHTTDLWTASLTNYLWVVQAAVDASGDLYVACNRSDGNANNFPSQRKYNGATGVLVESGDNGVENVQTFGVAAYPGRHPHFI